MKLSAAIVFAAAVASVSAKKNLRVPQINASNEPTDADARVTIHGTKGDPSDEDIEIVNHSIVKAYNQAYLSSGYSMNYFTTEISTLIEDASMVAAANTEGQLFLGHVQVSWDPRCRLCPPDVEATRTIKNLGDMHQAFENKFCADLRESGSDVLAEARDCSFSFLNIPGQMEENLPIVEQLSGQNAEVQLTFKGTVNNLSEKDMQIIDESIVSAYNEAFSSVGYKLKSFKTVADLDFPSSVSWDPTCRLCPPDAKLSRGKGNGKNKPTPAPTPSPPYVDPDCVLPYLRSCPFCESCDCYTWDCGPFGGDNDLINHEENNGDKLIIASAVSLGWDPRCRLCPPEAEDAATVIATPKLSDGKLAFLHTAFEKTLCAKLKNSGEVNFANVHNCSFRFVFSPASEATRAQA